MTTATSPRERLLSTASRLFYREGIQAVGVDRLVSEAGVTRATFYRHFPSKDDLVVAYLNRVDADLRSAVSAATGTVSPQQAVRAIATLIGRTVTAPDFRGCHFINASAEYPDETSAVRRSVADHRAWFAATLVRLATAAGHPDPQFAAQHLVLLHDGALAAGDLDDPAVVRDTVTRVVDEMFAPHADRTG